MSIEKEIKQTKPFRSSYQKVLVNLLFTTNWINTEQSAILKPHGLSPQQYNVLRILRGQHPAPITINGIIERMLDKMSNASRLVDKLLGKDLVTRTDNISDRRACDIRITEKGLQLLYTIDDLQTKWEASLQGLSPEEAAQLSDLLDKMRNK